MRFASGKQASGELKVNNALNHHWFETSLLPCGIQRFYCQNLVHVTSSVGYIQIA